MSKKQGLLLVILLAGAVALLPWLTQPRREPAYHGKPLSSWLKDMEDWDGDTNQAACVAFRETGTNAIPELLTVIESHGSPIQRMPRELNKRQSVVKLPTGMPVQQTMAATWALYAMGTNASPALPILTNLLFRNDASSIQSGIALAGIGSDGVPSLLAALTNRDWRIRHAAVSGLAWERSDFETVVPALIMRLQDDNRAVQTDAVISLGQLHVKPELAVPALLNAFTNNDALLRSSVLISLGMFEVEAKDSIPMVMSALQDNDESVRTSAGYAIKRIDPEAAVKAGVK